MEENGQCTSDAPQVLKIHSLQPGRHLRLMARVSRLTAFSLAPSSMCNLQPPGQDRNSLADLDTQMQEQERIINISYALASEASQRSKQVAGKAVGTNLQGPVPACCS